MKKRHAEINNHRLRLHSRSGITAELSAEGAALTALYVPGRTGVFENIVLSCADPSVFAGAIVAPAAGRISGGRVPIHGRVYSMPCNEGASCLHSGPETLGHAIWKICQASADSAVLEGHLADGACGLPGNRVFTVTYKLGENSLSIEICIKTDADTFINPTSHIYWNLSGDFTRPAYDHTLTVNAQRVWCNDAQHLPICLKPVQGTAFDFRFPRTILQAMKNNARDLRDARGYNNAFELAGSPAAVLENSFSGRRLVLETDAPYLVFYSGGFLGNGVTLANGSAAVPGCALAFEPQSVPDAPRLLGSDLPLLHSGETFRRIIRYRFGNP